VEKAWLRNQPSLKPSTPPLPLYEELTVSHLMNSDMASWDRNLVLSIFNYLDVVPILSTLLYNVKVKIVIFGIQHLMAHIP
jgi:hypothetical protein